MIGKKILIVGSSAIWAIENIYSRYLNTFGANATIFNCSDYISTSYWHRGLGRIGFNSIYQHVNRSLLAHCQKVKPDIIWVFKGIELFPDTLQTLKSTGVILINYNPDHPFIRSFRSSGGKNVPESIPLYDFHFCYSQELCKKIEKEYNIPSFWLHFGFEISPDQFNNAKNAPEILKACFVGNPDPKRVKIIKSLSAKGIPIDVFGNKWDKYINNNKNITCFPAVYGDDFWAVLRKYRVQINIFREHNEGSHNMRTFEIPAVGGVMLAPDSEEHRYFFEDKKDFFLYHTEESLAALCNKVLIINDIEELRENARNRSLLNDYSYRNRALTVYKTIFEF